jgi:hypothetical protein
MGMFLGHDKNKAGQGSKEGIHAEHQVQVLVSVS